MTPPQRELDPLPLRQHRLRIGVSLDEIIAKTKISRRFLEAIEAGDYRQLPGGIFTVSYIRQYAEAIGYEPDEVLEHYRRWTSAADEAAPEIPHAPQTQSIVRLARSLLLS